MKQLTLILGILFFLPFLHAISISPSSITLSLYGGECSSVGLTINNPHETDLATWLYYTTDLTDNTGLTLTATNPFIATKGDTTIPLQICTTPNFEPSSFNLTLYADSNIEQQTVTVYQNTYSCGGGGYTIVYKDKNVYIDKNQVIYIPKEIIKTIYQDKNVYIDKIITQPKHNNVFPVTSLTGLFGLDKDLSNAIVVLVACIITFFLGAGIVYFTLIKKTGGEK